MEEKRSLWKRFSEKAQTLIPIEPGSQRADNLSIEAQRENALNWLEKRSETFSSRKMKGIERDLPKHLLNDIGFASRYANRVSEGRAEAMFPLELRRSTQYLAETTHSYELFNEALKYDERSLQLPTKDHDEVFSKEEKLHAIERLRMLDKNEAVEFLTKSEFLDLDDEAKAMNALSEEVLTNKDFLIAIDRAGIDLHALPKHIRNNDQLMKDCLEVSPFFFEIASEAVRSDQECFDHSLQVDPSHKKDTWDQGASQRWNSWKSFHKKDAWEQVAINYKVAGEAIRENRDNFRFAERISHLVKPKDLPNSLRNDKELIETLLQDDRNALRFASRELRKDRQFVEEMTAKYAIDTSRFDLIKDRQIALNLARTDSIQLDRLPLDLQNDRDFVAGFVKLNGEQLQFAKPEFQDDYEIARNAVSCTFNDSAALEHCSSRLRADPSIVYFAVESNPYNIEYAAAELRDNDAMGMHAVKGAPWTVEYLSERLRNDLDIAKEVIAQDPESAMELGSDLKEKLIANLSLEDKKQYEHWYHEGESELAGKYIANGLEPYLISLEKENIAHELQKFQEREQERVISQSELSTKEDIAVWLKHYGVEDFTINDDLTVDVSGDVNLKSKFTGHEIETDIYVGDNLGHTVVEEKLSGIPFQFGKVEGNFDISDNGYDKTVVDVEGLKSLKGCPTEVKGNFDCSANPALRSLEDGPKVVGGNLNISNTSVESLEKAPRVNGQITAEGLPNLANEVKVRNDQSAAMAKLVAPYDAAKEGPLPSQVKKPKQVMKQKI